MKETTVTRKIKAAASSACISLCQTLCETLCCLIYCVIHPIRFWREMFHALHESIIRHPKTKSDWIFISEMVIAALILCCAVCRQIYLRNHIVELGDNMAGRPLYTTAEVYEENILGDKVVLNSISDTPSGSEKNFVYASGEKAVRDEHGNVSRVPFCEYDRIVVEPHRVYTIYLKVHNDNPNAEAVAKDVKVGISIPQESAEEIQVLGLVETSNTEPDRYWNDIVFVSEDGPFHLVYACGMARLYNGGIGADEKGYPLGDEVITQATEGGVLIGYDDLDGRIPGGEAGTSYVSILVLVVPD